MREPPGRGILEPNGPHNTTHRTSPLTIDNHANVDHPDAYAASKCLSSGRVACHGERASTGASHTARSHLRGKVGKEIQIDKSPKVPRRAQQILIVLGHFKLTECLLFKILAVPHVCQLRAHIIWNVGRLGNPGGGLTERKVRVS